ncbi:hypothetical protein PFICI_01626 [Pestalotiopsis fici W106-1]|uniref:SUR7 protein n=1 Tax=Pestalotiopsis fici (strain W106-1 / CGMCC3.15140) TaxID=1229662 RepID=W3XP20_PESFW|nr:uncharacterized protein PFICI_01626 [Pestalotiopsis fici W106-1]ETS87798.1 hypothetical protein PFICI_01626 [Pestalotiopsis fici W106-1]
MRIFAFVSGLFSLVALIAALLCLLAGQRLGFMEDADILTITVSAAGKAQLLNGTTSGETSVVGSQLEGLTAQTGVNDWFALHVMNYCKGSNANSTSAASESCSDTVPFFSFDTISIIDSELQQGVNLSTRGVDVGMSISASGWPSEISDISGKVMTAYKVMFFMLCMGIAASGVEAIASLLVMAMDARPYGHGALVSLINLVLSLIAFLGLGLASAIITGTMFTFVNTINSQGSDIGLSATKGMKFLCMTWLATILMCLAALAWVLDFFAERRNKRRLGDYAARTTELESYKDRERALKMEERLMKKRMALDRKISEAQRYKNHEGEMGVSLKPLPVETSSSVAAREVGDNVHAPTSKKSLEDIDRPEPLHNRPRVVQVEFV